MYECRSSPGRSLGFGCLFIFVNHRKELLSSQTHSWSAIQLLEVHKHMETIMGGKRRVPHDCKHSSTGFLKLCIATHLMSHVRTSTCQIGALLCNCEGCTGPLQALEAAGKSLLVYFQVSEPDSWLFPEVWCWRRRWVAMPCTAE